MNIHTKRIQKMTFLNEHRQSKISCLQHCSLFFARKQEILRLEITVDHSHEMASVHNIHYIPTNPSSISL
uniref:Uncharacterized protein MANES_16G007500 n=1 Tax=Rhizophora mucronata TaxID=61149 RepID=A0A2P2JVG6_RHIMU